MRAHWRARARAARVLLLDAAGSSSASSSVLGRARASSSPAAAVARAAAARAHTSRDSRARLGRRAAATAGHGRHAAARAAPRRVAPARSRARLSTRHKMQIRQWRVATRAERGAAGRAMPRPPRARIAAPDDDGADALARLYAARDSSSLCKRGRAGHRRLAGADALCTQRAPEAAAGWLVRVGFRRPRRRAAVLADGESPSSSFSQDDWDAATRRARATCAEDRGSAPPFIKSPGPPEIERLGGGRRRQRSFGDPRAQGDQLVPTRP